MNDQKRTPAPFGMFRNRSAGRPAMSVDVEFDESLGLIGQARQRGGNARHSRLNEARPGDSSCDCSICATSPTSSPAHDYSSGVINSRGPVGNRQWKASAASRSSVASALPTATAIHCCPK